ncbi:hypothetical protein H5410_026000 [Solanum commersonii]|uniref:F-box/LRR-repeat protein 15/At3g58940/PEG3-like LRR domain-containing protein n=1 Tax=Solanum commersonii TaxID=4109 RepID=A0A9J5YZJ3_SOLCO|nr:hypothetical protein H5410_026000 [Solanum commersonii]
MPIKYAARSSILSKHWRQLWFTQPNIVFDPLFFQYVSNTEDSAASVIHKLLLKHIGDILGFHLISEADTLTQSDVNQFIIFASNHGIQKLTLKMANDEKYVLPDSIFTCATLTHLKLSRCIFMLPDGTRFPNLISIQLEHSKIAGQQGSKNKLNLPILETLERFHGVWGIIWILAGDGGSDGFGVGYLVGLASSKLVRFMGCAPVVESIP